MLQARFLRVAIAGAAMKLSLKIFAAAFFLWPAFAHAADITGTPKILDGDTVQFGSLRVRLGAMASPETDQQCLNEKGEPFACGIAARDTLKTFAGDRPWTCRPVGATQHGSVVGRCTAGGEDVEKWMVRNGWGLASAREAKGYGADEAEARTSKAGLWAGAFVSPREWRNRNANAMVLGALKVTPATKALLLRSAHGANPPSPDCAIKANVNRSGTCIFHQPGGRFYAKIKMDNPEKGNRWFCTVSEAKAANCRETRR